MRAAGRFTVTGRLHGAPVTVTWNHEELTGTPAAVDAVHATLCTRGTVRLSPQSDEHPARVEDPTAVLAATQQVLDVIVAVDGDYPMPEADSSAS